MKAKLVNDFRELEKYKWCGHGVLAGRRKAGFLKRDYILSHFGENEKKAVQGYETFLRDRQGKYKGGEYSGGGLRKSMGGLGNVLTIGRSGEIAGIENIAARDNAAGMRNDWSEQRRNCRR
ncbi:MAG: hypothetical protein KKH28_01950 [Elusimicrobia bacterium]|nr:hypothetical protein [Elusimicrobiota bacterium]